MKRALAVALLALWAATAWADPPSTGGAAAFSTITADGPLDFDGQCIADNGVCVATPDNNGVSSTLTASSTGTQVGTVNALEGCNDADTACIGLRPLATGNILEATGTANFTLVNSTGAIKISSAANGTFHFEASGSAPVLRGNDNGGARIYFDDDGGSGNNIYAVQGDLDTGACKTGTADEFGLCAGSTTVPRLLVTAASVMNLNPIATAPATCSIGEFYVDTSGAACACSATDTWSNMHATGSCA